MALRYLDFDVSEDTEGIVTFDAMASVALERVAQVHAEIDEVLAWAFKAFPGGHGPLGEGFAWDHDLQSHRDAPDVSRHTITLSLSGTPDFAQAFREHFEPG